MLEETRDWEAGLAGLAELEMRLELTACSWASNYLDAEEEGERQGNHYEYHRDDC